MKTKKFLKTKENMDIDFVREPSLSMDGSPQNSSFANRSLWFMDAYKKGLNGNQTAWASKKYRGHWHRTIPESILEKADIH
jgi:hypothetical protein